MNRGSCNLYDNVCMHLYDLEDKLTYNDAVLMYHHINMERKRTFRIMLYFSFLRF